MLGMEAYAADCRLFGVEDVGEARLTDILNGTSELRLRDARLTARSRTSLGQRTRPARQPSAV
jgi:hypothetical protein